MTALEANVSTEPVEPAPEPEAQSDVLAYGSHPVNYGTYVVAEPAEPIIATPMPTAEPTPEPVSVVKAEHTEEGA